MKFTPQPMVNWYNMRQLAITGLKTVISSIFGNFADKREMQAVLSPGNDYHNYSKLDGCCIDYVSDIGDGFNPVYTIAHLLSQPHLEVAGKKLGRGRVLIMGGDEVYPTPEVENYRNRLQGPYAAANPFNESDKEPPHLFAIPGNHDWYDGLTNFLKLFCQKRNIGNWRTQQSRSYFAIKLPYNYWIWGIDIQLHAEIDLPQQNYFKAISEHMQENDKVIICSAKPAWITHAIKKEDFSYERLRFFIAEFIEKGNFKLKAIIAGDFHHYSHYVSQSDEKEDAEHLITSGGGGAFTHATHILKDSIDDDVAPHAKLVKTFPNKQESKRLSFKNLLFPFYGWGMALTLGLFHLVSAWIIQSTTNPYFESSFMNSLAALPISFENYGEALTAIWTALARNPSVFTLNVILLVGIIFFTDTHYGKGKLNYIAGTIHGILHVINLYMLIWLFSYINLELLGLSVSGMTYILIFAAEMVFIGSFTSGFIFGVYLLVANLFLHNHPTESNSSYQHQGYKNFLRLHLSEGRITIYPIGVRHAVMNWKNVGTEKKPEFKGGPVKFELIDNPIVL